MKRLIDIDYALKKERTDTEKKAALMAFDALLSVQSNTQILCAYMQEEIRKINSCDRLPIDMKRCSELGLPRDYDYALLLAAVDHYVSCYKASYEAMQKEANEATET